jgi:hypothetical protein
MPNVKARSRRSDRHDEVQLHPGESGSQYLHDRAFIIFGKTGPARFQREVVERRLLRPLAK